ncbi:MAG: 30S ribosomal protein S18 [Candidatus Uhrbacteria bacterium]|nr:30S ribosomal protein S18 [Candidatus Uhrbacteria bacterium]
MVKRKSLLKKQDKYCNFCVNKKLELDYKNTELLKRYLSSFAKIVPRKRSGICMKHQRKLSLEIKRSRIMALLPFVQQ